MITNYDEYVNEFIDQEDVPAGVILGENQILYQLQVRNP